MKRSLAGAVAAAVTAVLLSTPATAHADGETFTSVPLPFFWPDAELRDVAADDAGGIWIGGSQGAYCVMWGTTCAFYSYGNPVVRRWNGSSWAEYPLNGWTGEGPIRAVSTSGAETWIGGTSGLPAGINYLARFDGTAFQKVEKPTGATIDVISTGPAGTWVSHGASGDGPGFKLHKRTGSTWTGYDMPLHSVSDLQAVTATDAWAVGNRYVDSETADTAPAMAHYDGSTWTAVTPPPIPAGIDYTFVKVAPVGPNDVWALSRKHLTHWNGTDWTVIPLPPLDIRRGGDLAIDGHGDPWVVGAYDAHTPYRYSGGTWHSATMPVHKEMRAITVVPGTSTIWVVAGERNPVVLKNG